MSDASGSPWWKRHLHADRVPFLRVRDRIKRALRDWFHAQGFIEVECAALQVSPGNEAHLHAFETKFHSPGGDPQTFYLHTSPEFACKKLLAAGESKLFTFAPAYRNREAGRLHHPEFTMLEWYRSDADYSAMMSDCAAILATVTAAVPTTTFRFGDLTNPADSVPEEISVPDAFSQFASIDLLSTTTAVETDREALASAARTRGYRVADDDTWSDIYSRILVEAVEPNLGQTRATILKNYPVSEAALAARSTSDPRIAERFELYVCGVELANAFTELTDPAEQRRRFEAEMDEKQRVYGERYPIDEDFLAALAEMPPAAGCALGFDRLVMLATNAQRIDQVIWTPLALHGTTSP